MTWLIVVIVAGAVVVALVTAGNHLAASLSSDNPHHRDWDNPEPTFDVERVAGLNRYPDNYAFDIVGESHHQKALEDLCGGKCEDGYVLDSPALLVPYSNAHDDCAVAVLMGDSELVGHLSRHDARKLRIALKRMKLAGCSLKVPARIVGGWKNRSDEGHFGVKLDLSV